MTLPYVWSHSGIDGNGQEYISITLEEPRINGRDLYEGGKHLLFELNHLKQKTECYLCHWRNGVNQTDRTIKIWKGEILAESEMIKFAKDFLTK